MSLVNEVDKEGITFECPIKDNMKKTDHILFAYTYPFNLNDI